MTHAPRTASALQTGLVSLPENRHANRVVQCPCGDGVGGLQQGRAHRSGQARRYHRAACTCTGGQRVLAQRARRWQWDGGLRNAGFRAWHRNPGRAHARLATEAVGRHEAGPQGQAERCDPEMGPDTLSPFRFGASIKQPGAGSGTIATHRMPRAAGGCPHQGPSRGAPCLSSCCFPDPN